MIHDLECAQKRTNRQTGRCEDIRWRCPNEKFGRYSKYIEDIQMFLLNMSFISRVKWTVFIFHEWRSHE